MKKLVVSTSRQLRNLAPDPNIIDVEEISVKINENSQIEQ